MMEVARSGVFYPAQFSFPEIMMLFLGMMLGNVLLLDLYNTLGLPTSTTVSMVFGLLGAAVATALFRIAADPAFSLQDLSQFINTGKAMVIIAAILLSVAFAFIAGLIYMYVSRLIFSFRYAPVFRRWGAVWCGISLSGILYFALFKGLCSGLIPTSVSEYVTRPRTAHASHSGSWHPSCCGSSSGCGSTSCASRSSREPSLGPGLRRKLDLVNFIGVPLAAFDAWQIARDAGRETIMMVPSEAPARANFLILLVSGPTGRC